MKLINNKLRVVHFPQLPCKPFIVEVKDEFEAAKMMKVLADQHLFLYNENIIPDYSNIIIVEMYEQDMDGDGNPGWSDYWNEEESAEWAEVEDYFLDQQNM